MLLEYAASKVSIAPIVIIVIGLYHRDTLSSERSQCYSEGDLSIVNITYDNYLALLVGGVFSITGRVGVCLDGVYGSVCDANWDREDATAICNSLIFGIDFGE